MVLGDRGNSGSITPPIRHTLSDRFAYSRDNYTVFINTVIIIALPSNSSFRREIYIKIYHYCRAFGFVFIIIIIIGAPVSSRTGRRRLSGFFFIFFFSTREKLLRNNNIDITDQNIIDDAAAPAPRDPLQ